MIRKYNFGVLFVSCCF